VLHVTPQAVPSQVAVPFAGVGQAVQALAPHEAGLVFERQRPLQLCEPAAHWFMHAWFVGMQAPAQSFWLAGQVPPQAVPSQVAVPPVGTVQGVHEAPQVSTAAFETQAPLHRWKPVLQISPHVLPSQVAWSAFAATGQGAQRSPQEAMAVSSAQAEPQTCVPFVQPASGWAVSGVAPSGIEAVMS
jgi:hypothetical protein